MANPLLQNNLLKCNPQQLIQNNPQLQAILAMYKGDAKAAFFALCKQKGIDPQTILNQLK